MTTKRQTAVWVCVLTLAVLTLGGCRSSRETVAPAGPTTDTVTPVRMPQREYTVANFTASVAGITASGQMRIAQDSALWVSVSKLMEIGRAMATVDSVWVTAPMAGIRFAGTYVELSKRIGRTVSYDELQTIATSDDAAERMVRLARELGFDASVSFKRSQQVEHLTFPYKKP